MNAILDLVFFTAIACAGLSLALAAFLIGRATPEISVEERSYMDPLPPLLRPAYPLMRLLGDTLVQLYGNRYLDRVEKQLQRTGAGYLLTAEEFVALQLISALVFLAIGLLLAAALKAAHPLPFLLAAPMAGYLFPRVWLKDMRMRREREVLRSLPVYLDFITMAVEAGLNLTGAMQQAMQKAPQGPLRNEFATVLRDLRSGVPRGEALRRMAERLDIPDVTRFVNAMVQAEKMGSSMAGVMRVQSEQRRNERFQRAEKKAMQAPVKLIFPLIVFIFPVTFIILGFPIAMKFLGD